MKSFTEIRRWATLRCAHCGHRFRWSRDARHATGNRDGNVYHGPCLSYIIWRRDAEQRLEVLGWVMEIADITPDDVKSILELRMSMDLRAIDQGGKAWRVFNDLKKSSPQPSVPSTKENNHA